MSVTSVKEKTKLLLWGKAAGRCQYDGCNQPLYMDLHTKAEFNQAYIAHIIADKPAGPRGHPVLSERLKSDLSNLMLLCDSHHRLIDKEDIAGHPVERLRQMKQQHEDRMALLSSVSPNKKSHILLYGARIGEHHSHMSWQKAAQAMLPNYYPAERHAFELGLGNSSFKDNEKEYWEIERKHLRRQFEALVKPRLAQNAIEHLSIFALAPQPLLIELGRLLSDIPAAEVYQLHREPPDWVWQDKDTPEDYIIISPENNHKVVALKIELSASIVDDRVLSVIEEPCSIWTLTIPEPNNDFLKSKEQLSLFRQHFRRLLDKIKGVHGEDTVIHLFPAMPVAVAVEIGRVWMPKADLPIQIYDQNRSVGGFFHVFTIN